MEPERKGEKTTVEWDEEKYHRQRNEKNVKTEETRDQSGGR